MQAGCRSPASCHNAGKEGARRGARMRRMARSQAPNRIRVDIGLERKHVRNRNVSIHLTLQCPLSMCIPVPIWCQTNADDLNRRVRAYNAVLDVCTFPHRCRRQGTAGEPEGDDQYAAQHLQPAGSPWFGILGSVVVFLSPHCD